MKTFLILYIFFTSNILFCQNQNEELYLIVNDLDNKDVSFVKNDLSEITIYAIRELIDRKKNEIYLSENGEIKTKIMMPSSQGIISSITLKHLNENNQSPPVIIKADEVKNKLVYPDDFENIELKNILDIIKKFKKIYIIDSRYPDLYYKAREVELSSGGRL